MIERGDKVAKRIEREEREREREKRKGCSYSSTDEQQLSWRRVWLNWSEKAFKLKSTLIEKGPKATNQVLEAPFRALLYNCEHNQRT